MSRNVVVLLNNWESCNIVKDSCKKADICFREFERLLKAEIEQTGKQKKKGLWDLFDDILDRIQDEE